MGNSGIFGYINYLVEKDRKTILDTLVKGMRESPDFTAPPHTQSTATERLRLTHNKQVSRV
jgi:hypothetical protein